MLRATLRAFIRKHVAADIPDEMDGCFDCNALQCLDREYEICPLRVIRARRASDARLVESAQLASGY